MKKCISLFLALALCLGLSVPAWAAEATFTDVPAGHWAYAQIERAFSEGVIAGTYYDESTGERRFSPDEPMTMAQLVTILCRKFFPDEMETSQATGPWYAQAQEVALKHNLYGWTTEGYQRDGQATQSLWYGSNPLRDTPCDRMCTNGRGYGRCV